MLFSEIKVISVYSPPFGQNAYIVYLDGSDECFLVDTGFDAENIVRTVRGKNLTPKSILITHGHIDHIAGISTIVDEWNDCDIIIGSDDRDKLTDPMKNLSAMFGAAFTADKGNIRTVDDGDVLNVTGIPIQVLHVPGHSKGHVAFVIRRDDETMAFVGDIIFAGGVGRSDFPDGNERQLLNGIRDKIFALPDGTILMTGHGEETTVGSERQYNPYLSGLY
ncbi:MAG: MBL fold metallo-hydrolase [Planctomycetaceae bacterium]|jgi:hydroxyacylglutathione hydrolase|nr:MBL fold metallo-hydrolase [Planctomycetaceae bacterium]